MVEAKAGSGKLRRLAERYLSKDRPPIESVAPVKDTLPAEVVATHATGLLSSLQEAVVSWPVTQEMPTAEGTMLKIYSKRVASPDERKAGSTYTAQLEFGEAKTTPVSGNIEITKPEGDENLRVVFEYHAHATPGGQDREPNVRYDDYPLLREDYRYPSVNTPKAVDKMRGMIGQLTKVK